MFLASVRLSRYNFIIMKYYSRIERKNRMTKKRIIGFLYSIAFLVSLVFTQQVSALGTAPATGDQSHLKLWIGIFAACGVLLIVYLILNKKNRRG